MQAGARRRLRSIVQDCQRWLSDASNNRFRSQGRQMADRMSDLESFLMNDVEDAIVPEAVLAEMLRELLPLADSLASFADSAASTLPDSPCNPDCVPPPAGPQRDLWAARWTGALHDTAMLFGLLARRLYCVCTDDADFQRLLAATAVVVSAGGLGCQRLAELSLHEQRQLGTKSINSEVVHVDDCVSRHLSVMTEMLMLAAEVGTLASHSLLGPSRVLPWLRQVLPVIRWIDEMEGTASLKTPAAWPELFHNLQELQQHAEAMYADAALCSELASFTAASHAACVAAPRPDDKAWVHRHKSITCWLSSWRNLVPTTGQQVAPGLLPLQAAAVSILHNEVGLLRSLPVSPAAEAGQVPDTYLLVSCWESSVEAVGSCTLLLLQPAGSAQALPARAQRVLHAVASSAPAVTRFVAAAAGSQKVAAYLASYIKVHFISQLSVWASAVVQACDTHSRGIQAAATAPGSDTAQLEDMQRELDTAAGLLHSVLRLLAQLPPLAAAVADARLPRGRPNYFSFQPTVLNCLSALNSACALLGAVSGACRTQRTETEEQAAPHLPKLVRAHAGCCQLAHALLAAEERQQNPPKVLGMREENNALALLQAVLQISGDAHLALPKPPQAGDSTPEQEQWDRWEWQTAREGAVGLLACYAPPSPSSNIGDSSAPVGSAVPEAGEEAALAKLAQAVLHSPDAAALLPALLQRLLPPNEPAAGSDAGAGSSSNIGAASSSSAGDASSSGASNAAAGRAWSVLCEEAEVLQAQALAQRGVCCNLQCPHLCLAAGYRTKACGRCRLVRYCCTACQRVDYPRHRLACKALARIASATAGKGGAAAEADACP